MLETSIGTRINIAIINVYWFKEVSNLGASRYHNEFDYHIKPFTDSFNHFSLLL